MSFGVFVSV